MKPIGADFGRLDKALRFISRSTSIARISAAAAGPRKRMHQEKPEPNGGCRHNAR
jgi:hypothetical protein